jgi:hypothetical protein
VKFWAAFSVDSKWLIVSFKGMKPLPLFLLGALVASLFLPSAIDAAEIANREPQPGEIGYRPADGETSAMNPPSWIWLHEAPAETYSIQWSRAEDFAGAESVEGLRFNTYTHTESLKPGEWFWRYRFRTGAGEISNWSQTRRVRVPEEASVLPLPGREEIRERVVAGRPRLLIGREDLPGLREGIAGAEAEAFARLRAQADRHIQTGPTPEPEHMGSARDKENEELVRHWWPNRVQTVRAGQEAELLAFMHLVTGEEKYGEAARKWILHLAGWDPDGPTQFHLNCEAAKPMLYYLPRAYDWAYDTLSSEERETVAAVMRRRCEDAWKSGEILHGTGHLNRPYGSHANRLWHKLGEAAIAFYEEIPEAELWLDYAVNKFYAAYPMWADDDGGWHEGMSYMGSYIGRVIPWLMTARSTLGIDGLKKPFFSRVGDFPMYVAAPRAPNSGFGDQAHNPPGGGWGSMLDYFLRVAEAHPESAAQAPYWRWWMEEWGFSGQGGLLGLLIRAQLPELPAARKPEEIPQSKVFWGTGIASLHSNLLDSRENVHFLFKSSPFGRQSHGHNPHNSFQLNAYGEALLTTCVYRDLHGSRFHFQWAHSTRAHNAVLVNGQEQVRRTPAPHGRIVDFMTNAEWDYVSGEAADAYGDLLERYVRHVVFVKPDILVIYDELEAREPATFQFMLHAEDPFKLLEEEHALRLDREKAGLDARYLSPVELAFRQWDGYEPPPERRQFPNQWHVETATVEKRKSLGMLTVVVPYRAGERVEWTAEREESDTAVGLRFTRDGEERLVAIRKAGAGDTAELGGWQFTGPTGLR